MPSHKPPQGWEPAGTKRFSLFPLRVHGKVVILQAENQSYVFPFKLGNRWIRLVFAASNNPTMDGPNQSEVLCNLVGKYNRRTGNGDCQALYNSDVFLCLYRCTFASGLLLIIRRGNGFSKVVPKRRRSRVKPAMTALRWGFVLVKRVRLRSSG